MADDIICLSSDNEDSSQSSQNPIRNGSQSSCTLHLGGFISKTDKPQLISNGHNSTATSRSTAVNPKKEPDDDIVCLNSDDDSEIEVEYWSQGRGQNSNGNGGTQTVDDSDDDDDIQVLEENIKVNHQHTPEKLLIKSMNDRRKSYQEKQQIQKTEVKLGVPQLQGLTPGVHKEPKDAAVGVAEASGDGNSSSQDAVVMDEDVVMEEPVEEDVGEEEEKDDEVISSCSSGSGCGSGTDKPKDVDYKAKSRNSLERFLNELCARSKARKDWLKEARKKLMDAYEKTLDLNMTVHRRLHERIEHDLEIIRSSAEEQWKTIADLLVYIKPVNLTIDQIKTEDEIKEEREAQKMDLRRKYELELARLQMKIKELEVAEVDWEDDYNSNYMLLQKYKAKLVNAYYTLCSLSKCSHLTGRPTQTRITLKNHNAASNYPDIDAQVEKFVNKMGFLLAPDYTDILEIIQKTNMSKSLGLRTELVRRTALKMFGNIVQIIKKRRMKDFKLLMLTTLIPTPEKSGESSDSNTPSTSGTNPSRNDDVDDPEELEKQLRDPADLDPELLAKLEENVKLRKSESEVIDRFADIEEDEEDDFQHEEMTEDEDDDDKVDGEPPAKRRRADKNFNEESEVVTKLVNDSEEIAVVSVPATPLAVENNSNSLA